MRINDIWNLVKDYQKRGNKKRLITRVAVAQPFSFTVIPKNKMKTDLF